METINFTPKEREIIAEFVYSEQQDILIVSDAERLIEVLAIHKLIDNKDELLEKLKNKKSGIVNDLLSVLASKVSTIQGRAIMAEYFGGEYKL